MKIDLNEIRRRAGILVEADQEIIPPGADMDDDPFDQARDNWEHLVHQLEAQEQKRLTAAFEKLGVLVNETWVALEEDDGYVSYQVSLDEIAMTALIKASEQGLVHRETEISGSRGGIFLETRLPIARTPFVKLMEKRPSRTI